MVARSLSSAALSSATACLMIQSAAAQSQPDPVRGLTVLDSVFMSNDAACSRPWTTTGGALYISGSVQLTVSGCRFVSNHAAGNGGAIDLDGPTDVTITTTTFESNRCGGSADGVAVHWAGGRPAHMPDSYSNEEASASAAFGRPDFVVDPAWSIADSNACSATPQGMATVVGWAAACAGGNLRVCLVDDAAAVGTPCASGCSPTNAIVGGSLTLDCAKSDGERCVVSDRLVIGHHDDDADHNCGAAAVFLRNLRFADLHKSSSSTDINAGGGAIVLHNSDGRARNGGLVTNSLTIISCAFERNSVPYDSVGGGAISARPGTRLTVLDSVFMSNDAARSRPWTTTGGALYISGSVQLTVSGCRFVSNHAAGNGGAIDLDGTSTRDVTITTTTFESNRSDRDGVAVHWTAGRTSQVYSNDEANTAFSGAGDSSSGR